MPGVEDDEDDDLPVSSSARWSPSTGRMVLEQDEERQQSEHDYDGLSVEEREYLSRQPAYSGSGMGGHRGHMGMGSERFGPRFISRSTSLGRDAQSAALLWESDGDKKSEIGLWRRLRRRRRGASSGSRAVDNMWASDEATVPLHRPKVGLAVRTAHTLTRIARGFAKALATVTMVAVLVVCALSYAKLTSEEAGAHGATVTLEALVGETLAMLEEAVSKLHERLEFAEAEAEVLRAAVAQAEAAPNLEAVPKPVVEQEPDFACNSAAPTEEPLNFAPKRYDFDIEWWRAMRLVSWF